MDEYADQGAHNVTLDYSTLREATFNAASDNRYLEDRAIIVAHSHPFQRDPSYSSLDDSSEPMAFVALTAEGEGPQASLLFGDDTLAGRVWPSDVGRIRNEEVSGTDPIDEIVVVGDDQLKRIQTTNSRLNDSEEETRMHDRQALVHGGDGNAALQSSHVAVVGAGGFGSLVVQSLAHLGVGSLTVVDPDVVEETNRSRIVGARPDDAGPADATPDGPGVTPAMWAEAFDEAGRSKVEVMQRLVEEIDPSIQFNGIHQFETTTCYGHRAGWGPSVWWSTTRTTRSMRSVKSVSVTLGRLAPPRFDVLSCSVRSRPPRDMNATPQSSPPPGARERAFTKWKPMEPPKSVDGVEVAGGSNSPGSNQEPPLCRSFFGREKRFESANLGVIRPVAGFRGPTGRMRVFVAVGRIKAFAVGVERHEPLRKPESTDGVTRTRISTTRADTTLAVPIQPTATCRAPARFSSRQPRSAPEPHDSVEGDGVDSWQTGNRGYSARRETNQTKRARVRDPAAERVCSARDRVPTGTSFCRTGVESRWTTTRWPLTSRALVEDGNRWKPRSRRQRRGPAVSNTPSRLEATTPMNRTPDRLLR